MFRTRLFAAALLLAACGAAAAPRTPAGDGEVLERVPARANDPSARERAALRRAAAAAPADPAAAAALARALMQQALAEGDPRPVGRAQAALARWWKAADPPPAVRVQRGVIRQYGHDFDAALADLRAAAAAQPDDAEAWAWIAAVQMVQADYAGAAQACTRLAPLTSALIAAACTAYADSMRGRAGPAAQSLRAALDAGAREGPGDAAQRVWALTRLAEIEIRRGETAAAEAAFRAALALDASDAYLLAAWADLLLDQQRPAEAITALAGREAADVLLLRLAIAGRRVQHPDAGRWRDALAERFAAAARRGDALHRKEEARFLLEVIGDPARALPLARENWQRQREETDARLLLQAALAAREPKTAEPALQWMATHGVESRRLAVLAQRLAELK